MELLEEAIAGLNPEQKEAVVHDHAAGGQLLVLAGAGSGKTRVLTLRIARLVETGAAPERIVCVTFTVAAAAEMRERLALWLGKERAGRIRACTFHSLAWTFLRESPPGSSLPPGWKLLGFPARPRIAEAEEPDPDSPASASAGRPAAKPPRAPGAPRGEEVALDELMPLASELLATSPEALAAWRRSCEHLLIDEFQDIDPGQYAFCRTLAGDSPNLCAVGDDDQAIYGFRGADPGCILGFLRDFPGGRLVKLETNYRSHPHVLELANRIFADKEERFRKTLRPPASREGERGDPPRAIRLDSGNGWDQMRLVAALVRMRAAQGVPVGKMAVLCRVNRLCATMRRGMDRFGVPQELVVQTVHASKGLEYDTVFLVGLEEGLFPLEDADLQEERRLFYVAVTRARERLYLLRTKERVWKGKRKAFKPSRFLRWHVEPLGTRLLRGLGLSDG